MLRPVELGGVTVSRANLHNREEVARKDIREGDLVRVQRAGDVIPQVVERVPEPGRKRTEPFRMPHRCPSCDSVLAERGPFTVCSNSYRCAAQLAGRLEHFASRDALDIDGLGEETAKLLVTEGLVLQLPDLFRLTPNDLVRLEGFAEKSATSLVRAIGAATDVELHRFLLGLGIPEVGVTVAKILARKFRSFGALRAATSQELEAVEGIGPKMAQQIELFFLNQRNKSVLDDLAKQVTLREIGDEASEALAGVKFVFTGGLSELSRREAKGLAESLGAKVSSSVSKQTGYVVVGSDPGSKYDKAVELGVKTLDEREFLQLMRQHGAEV
jgi:DNA ligase (NAD+)